MSDHREVCLAEGDLPVELNIESVVLLTVHLMIMMLKMTTMMSSPVHLNLMNIQFVDEILWFFVNFHSGGCSPFTKMFVFFLFFCLLVCPVNDIV